MRKGILPYLVICFSFMILSKITIAQKGLQQLVINENDLIKSWKLESATTCDRCRDYIPKDTLKLNFYANYICSGIIEGIDTSLTGSWVLNGNQLSIQYKSKSGEVKTKKYRVYQLTQNILVLIHNPPYHPGAKRTFILIK